MFSSAAEKHPHKTPDFSHLVKGERATPSKNQILLSAVKFFTPQQNRKLLTIGGR